MSASWKQLKLPAVSQGVTDDVRNALQTFSNLLSTAVQILELVQSLLVALKDPRAALINRVVDAVKQFLENLKETGVFFLPAVPQNLRQLVHTYRGGHPRFEEIVLNSLNDTDDPERPQIGPNGQLGGLLVNVVADSGSELLETLRRLIQFINRRFGPKYPAPVNLRTRLGDSNGIPLDKSFAGLFSGNAQKKPSTLILQWEEDAVEGDIFLNLFEDSKFYIEKLQSRSLDDTPQNRPNKAKEGPLGKKKKNSGGLQNPQIERGRPAGRTIPYWTPVDPNNPFVRPAQMPLSKSRKNFLTGSYAYVIDNQKRGEQFGTYYRVWAVPEATELEKIQGRHVLTLDGELYTGSLSSKPVYGVIPKVDPNGFDLPTAIWNTYRAAYLLRFDEDVLGRSGTSLIGSGRVEPSIPASLLERDLGGNLTTLNPSGTDPVVYYSGSDSGGLIPDGDPGMSHKETMQFLNNPLTRDPSEFTPFGGADEFLSPQEDLPPHKQFRLGIDSLIENKVEKLTRILSENDSLFNSFRDRYLSAQPVIEEFLLKASVMPDEFTDESPDSPRSKVLGLIRLLEGNIQTGQPPNWQSIQLIDDFLPPISQFLDRLINIVETLQNVVNGAISELSESIESIQDQIRAINELIRLIEEIISLIEKLLQLQNRINLLWVPISQGGKQGFSDAVLNSRNKPQSDNDDFTFGFVFAVGGPSSPDVSQPSSSDDLQKSVKGIKQIFGI